MRFGVFFFDSCVLVFKWYVERINNPCKVLCGGGWVLWNPRTILKDILRGGWTADKILRKFVWQFKKWHMRDCCNTGWFWEKKKLRAFAQKYMREEGVLRIDLYKVWGFVWKIHGSCMILAVRLADLTAGKLRRHGHASWPSCSDMVSRIHLLRMPFQWLCHLEFSVLTFRSMPGVVIRRFVLHTVWCIP